MREPFAGVTPRLYWQELSDREIFESYLAPRDDDHHLIPLRKRQAWADGGASGSIERAAIELPSWKDLGLSEERLQAVMAINPRAPMDYLLMFWSVWLRRGLTLDEVEERWRKKVS